MLQLDGYIRVSRVGGREGEGYISPDEQRRAIEAYAAELGGEIVAWHDDQDFSGGNTQRPGFEAMLARLEAGETDGVVVMKIDRFARSTADGARIVEEIVGRDQVFASCHERMDPRTPEGRYMLRSFLNNAELFLDQIKASWVTAKGRAIARGAHIGPTPTGYLKVEAIPSKPSHISPVDSQAIGGPTGPGLLVPSPTFGPAITELFLLAAAGREGDSVLARWMDRRAPREGGAPWNPSEIRRWLCNRIYLGEVRYGALVNADAHEPLTDEKTWQRCQREPGEQRRADSPFLLRGLIRCAACRYAMGGQTHGGGGGQTPVYRCYRGTRGCPAPAVITAERIESHVSDLAVEYQRGLVIAAVDDESADSEAIEAFEAAAGEVDTFVGDAEARALMGEQAWQEGLRVRVERREALRPGYEQALARVDARARVRRSVEDVDEHDLRDLLNGTIRHIFVRRHKSPAPGNRALVVWSDDTRAIDVPGRHNRRGPFDPISW